MRRFLLGALSTLVFLVPVTVSAQQGRDDGAGGVAVDPSTAPRAGDASAAAQEEAGAPVARDEVWDAYNAAFALLLSGKRDEALVALGQLRDAHPNHPAGVAAAELLSRVPATDEGAPGVQGADDAIDVTDRDAAHALAAPVPEPPPAGGNEAVVPSPDASGEAEAAPGESRAQKTGLARGELILFQTLHGLAFGVESCVVFACQGPRSWALSLVGFTGMGLGLSTFLSSGGVTPGQTASIDAGVVWGAYNAVLFPLALDLDVTGEGYAAILMGGQLAGLAAGWLLHRELKPHEGDVSMVTSGGLWLTTSVLMLAAAAELDDGQAYAGLALGAADVGLLVGALVANIEPMPRSRVLMIDAGALLGALTGFAVPVLLFEAEKPAPIFAAGLAGQLAGLGLAYQFTRDWKRDEDEINANVALAPVKGGAMGSFSMTF